MAQTGGEACEAGTVKDRRERLPQVGARSRAVLDRGPVRGATRSKTARNNITRGEALHGAALDRATPLGAGSLNVHQTDTTAHHVSSCEKAS